MFLSSSAQKSFIVAFLFTAAALFFFLFFRGFCEPDEGRYAEIPREMVASGNWLEMRMLGYRYYEKPPLTYWITAVPIKIFGAKDWAVRIPLLFNIIAIVAVFYWLLKPYWGKHLTLLSLFFMLQTIGFISGAGLLITDAYLILWFALSIILFFKAMEETDSWISKRIILLAFAGIAASLGVLTKGFVAVVLPAAILGIWVLCFYRSIKKIIHFFIAGIFVCCVVAFLLLPIFLVIERHNPGFIKQFIYEEHIARFIGTRAIQLHPEPWYFFLWIIPILLIPISLFLPYLFKIVFSNKIWKQGKLVSLLIVWIGVVVVFFSISTGKLMSYILPAFPPIALLLARYGILYEENNGSNNNKRSALWKFGWLGPILISIALIPAWFLFYFKLVPGKEVYGISGASCIALLPVIFSFAMTLLWKQLFTQSGLLLLNSGILFATSILLSPISGKDFNVLVRRNSSYVYKAIAKELKEEDKIVVFWSYRPALPFYTQRIYKSYQEHNELIYGMNLEPELSHALESPEELKKWLNEDKKGRVFGVFEPCGMQDKFLTLNVKTKSVPTIPSDPNTIVLEILRN